MSDYIEYITPTGLDQSTQIQAVIDDLEASSGDSNTIVLAGEYLLGTPISTGATDGSVAPVCIRGVASSVLRYVANSHSTSYLVTFEGGSSGYANWQVPRLSEIQIDCGTTYRCRGVKFSHQKYQHLWDNLRILRARGVAVDCPACFGSRGRGLLVGLSDGIALRLATCSDFLATSTRIWYMAGSTWPATDDTSVINYSGIGGTYVQTAATERALVVIDDESFGVTFDVLNFEQCQSSCANYPLIYAGIAHHLVLNNLYDEKNVNTYCKVLYRGLDTDDSRAVALWINNPWSIHYQTGSDCVTFLQLEGRTAGTRITDCHLYGDTGSEYTNIVLANGGIHEKTVIEGSVRTKNNIISQANWWGTAAGGAWKQYRGISSKTYSDADHITNATSRRDDSVSVSDLDAYYLGDSTTDGSWRLIRSGDNLLRQRRESGNWVTKGTDTP